jgi:low affinity Fe/Cu permease
LHFFLSRAMRGNWEQIMARRAGWLERASSRVTAWAGSSWAFGLAFAVILVWAVTGPIFHYSDTWQLVINTGTTIVTFLMVFLIQSTQNRDAKAMHLKLDELLRGVEGARTSMVDLEHLSDEDLKKLEKEFQRLRERGPNLAHDDLERIESELHERMAHETDQDLAKK